MSGVKELKTHEDWSWNAWFWVDKEEFDGEWRIGQCRYHVEKAVGRDTDGRLFLMVWTNHDKYNSSNFSQIFYEIDLDEYFSLLERAVAQGEVKPNDRDYYADMPKSPFTPPWDIKKDVVVYHDEKYTLGQKNKEPYLVANGKKFKLSCHPYEPCLYITDESGFMSVVHNAFDPFDVLKAFFYGECISSITGFEYDAKDFCRMVEYAADKVDIGFDYAEKVFGDRPKKKATAGEEEAKTGCKVTACGEAKTGCKVTAGGEGHNDIYECSGVKKEDDFYDLIAEYPDCVIDYCIVKGEAAYRECESHWLALCFACRRLFKADESGLVWHYDACKARARKISTKEFFESEDERD